MLNNIRQWISCLVQWMANNWRTRGGISVIAFLAVLLIFPLLTFRGFVTSTSGGTVMSTISFPFVLLGALIAGGVIHIARNENSSKLAIGGLISLSFFCFLLAIGDNHPLNTRIGILWDSITSFTGLGLIGLGALAYFGAKGENGIPQNVMKCVLIAVSVKFALPLIQGYWPEATKLWKDVTGIDFGLSAFLAIFSTWLLFSKVQDGNKAKKRIQGFPRLALWLILISILLPSAISSNAKVINDGREAFKKEVPGMFNWSNSISIPSGGLLDAMGIHWNNFVDTIKIDGEKVRKRLEEEKKKLSSSSGSTSTGTTISTFGVPASAPTASASTATASVPAAATPLASSQSAPAVTAAPTAKTATSGPLPDLDSALLLKGECRSITTGIGSYAYSASGTSSMSYAGDGKNFLPITGGRFEVRSGDTNPRVRAVEGGNFTVRKM
jgi:hypothetical protein